jgi:hypothetical protein
MSKSRGGGRAGAARACAARARAAGAGRRGGVAAGGDAGLLDDTQGRDDRRNDPRDPVCAAGRIEGEAAALGHVASRIAVCGLHEIGHAPARRRTAAGDRHSHLEDDHRPELDHLRRGRGARVADQEGRGLAVLSRLESPAETDRDPLSALGGEFDDAVEAKHGCFPLPCRHGATRGSIVRTEGVARAAPCPVRAAALARGALLGARFPASLEDDNAQGPRQSAPGAFVHLDVSTARGPLTRLRGDLPRRPWSPADQWRFGIAPRMSSTTAGWEPIRSR